MNLKKLSDQDILSKTDDLARREREFLTQVLHHLREIERRRLFSDLRFKSLFDYAVKRLGYSEDQAARRISAMRLLNEMPELETQITSGALTLTNIGLAQNLFRKERKIKPYTPTEKKQLLDEIQNKSKREAEKIIVSKATEPLQLRPEHVRPVTETLSEVRFVANSELLEKLEKVKGLLAHSKAGANLSETIDALCNLAIEKLDPAQKAKSQQHRSVSRVSEHRSPAPVIKRRISIHQRREVWWTAKSRCQVCGSFHALQVDHITPVASGGGDEPENLRLLCRNCNQRAAVVAFCVDKMQRFLETMPFDS